MTPRARHHAVDSISLHLHAWKPFDPHSSPSPSLPPSPSAAQSCAKKPCRSDRSTFHLDLDLSRLSLLEDPRPQYKDPHGLLRIARKRRRHGSRSISGRSSDRSATRLAAGVAYSDFHIAGGGCTDSSGEFFLYGDGSWGSDVSEAMRVSGVRAGEGKDITPTPVAPHMERENPCSSSGAGSGSNKERESSLLGHLEPQGNDSGYGSEPGYRGDAELGYDDEIDEEEDDGRLLFWGKALGDHGGEVMGGTSFSEQKAHYRCRRKKQDWRIFAPSRW